MLEYGQEDTEREYYIVFDNRRGNFSFWNIFTWGGFDHVYLMTEIDGKTLLLWTNPSDCLIDVWDATIEMAVAWHPPDVVSILKYKAKYKSLKRWRPRGIITCVSFAKYMLGIRGFCMTPRGLHKYLIKLGAEDGRKFKTESNDE